MRQKKCPSLSHFPSLALEIICYCSHPKDTSHRAPGRGKVALTLLPDDPEMTWLWTAQHREAFPTGDARLSGSLTWPFHL